MERPDALRPNYWIRTSSAGNGDNKTEVADDRIVDGQKDDVANDGRCLN